MDLSPNQEETLRRFRLGLPKSMSNWPGVPFNMVDNRSIGALVKKGLVECVMHERKHASQDDHISRTPCYRLTDAGRAILATLGQ